MESILINRTKEFAKNLLMELPDTFVYHNLHHTESVVRAAEEIGKAIGLNESEMEILIAAAWLHDTGYKSDIHNHEDHSIHEAIKLLTEIGASDKITVIAETIMATKIPQQPRGIVAEALSDSDLYNLSTNEFLADSERLREEWSLIQNKVFDDKEWIANSLSFMKSHCYFTSYGKIVLTSRKNKNIRQLEKLLGNYGSR